MSLKHEISFRLNGKPATLSVAAHNSTLELLREKLRLTGTKHGCGEGECGACTILVDGISVNACLMFAVDCDGREVTTIEGLRAEKGLSELQKAFVEEGAVQCGFCTPGMIAQATHLRNTCPGMNREEIRRGIEGNLCRCTGYKKIVDAISSSLEKRDS
ncbi:MAG: ferredoxin [Gammaproteobacteria bacterium]|jgi:carbon-monoxide dehydrogenase small subunit|nr:ferredoxin [Gammaproteobacteria bacterium]|tara:strand:- start:730 stop:1206 length:477 start_codon:yes stop_codon:yes gene_type:complete